MLREYRHLEECLLVEVLWKNYGLTLECIFNYIWTPDGKVRRNLAEPDLVTVTFDLVQELHVQNALNEAMCREPERINWGISEIALMRLEEHQDFLHPYQALPIPFHHMAIIRHQGSRTDIVFSTFEMSRRQVRS